MMFSKATLLSAIALSSAVVTTQAAEGVYSYDFTDPVLGPDGWATLPIENNQCGGASNSPIAVTASACDKSADYALSPGAASINELEFFTVDNGVKVNFPAGVEPPKLQIPDVSGTYNALQFHVHTGSEHSIGNMFYDLELHVVHQLDPTTGTGQGPSGERNGFAVVGMVLSKGGDFNPLFDEFLDGWKDAQLNEEFRCNRRELNEKPEQRQRKASSTMSIYDLLDKDTDFFFYSGGLTTPPCTEVVWWNLAAEPVIISDDQYEDVLNIVKNYKDSSCAETTLADPVTFSTSRPPQPLNGRKVTYTCPSSGITSILAPVNGFLCGLLGC